MLAGGTFMKTNGGSGERASGSKQGLGCVGNPLKPSCVVWRRADV